MVEALWQLGLLLLTNLLTNVVAHPVDMHDTTHPPVRRGLCGEQPRSATTRLKRRPGL
jgi:hypothetical protein